MMKRGWLISLEGNHTYQTQSPKKCIPAPILSDNQMWVIRVKFKHVEIFSI